MSKVKTLEDVKTEDNNKLILNSSQYRKLISVIDNQQQQIEELLKNSKIDEMEKEILNQQLEEMADLARNFKKQLKNKSIEEETIKQQLNQYQENFNTLQENIKKKPCNKYNEKSKEELLKIAMERIKPLNSRFNDLYNE
jgi:DNA repair ATPase RecN